MNFANVPQWAWILLGVGAVFFALRTGWLENLLKKPVSGTAGATPGASLSLLDSLQGYKTKLAALVVAVAALGTVILQGMTTPWLVGGLGLREDLQ